MILQRESEHLQNKQRHSNTFLLDEFSLLLKLLTNNIFIILKDE